MCDLESVFEVRSGMCGEPGEGSFEGGLFSNFELAKECADEAVERLSNPDSLQWISESRAKGRFYWVEINEHDIIYSKQE